VLARAALGLHRAHGRDASLQPTCFPPLLEARPLPYYTRACPGRPGCAAVAGDASVVAWGGGRTGGALQFGSKLRAGCTRRNVCIRWYIGAAQAASPKEDAVWEGVQRIAGVLDAGRSFWTGETARSESFSEREMWEA